jgi:hypothetical protein
MHCEHGRQEYIRIRATSSLKPPEVSQNPDLSLSRED